MSVAQDVTIEEGMAYYDGTGWLLSEEPFTVTSHEDFSPLGLRLGVETASKERFDINYSLEGRIMPAPSEIDFDRRLFLRGSVSVGLGFL